MNNVNLIGRLVKDPEVRETGKGKDAYTVASFTLAVDSKKDEADFIRCVAFGGMADTIDQYIKKGDQIGVTGRIQTGSYENKEGQKVYTTDIIVERFDFGAKSAREEESSGKKRR